MQTARVIGTARSTIKHPSMEGWKLLVAQPFAVDGRTPDGDPQLVIDRFGAGTGDTIIMTSDGKWTSELVGSKQTPIRWSVMGVVD